MNEVQLGPEELQVIAAARDAHAPSEMQRARVRKGLDAKLAAGIAAPLLASSTALAAVLKVSAGVVLVAAVGTGAAYVATSRPWQTTAPPALPTKRPATWVATPAALALPAPAATPAAAAEARPAAGHPRNLPRRREAGAPPPADLAGELALLTQASAATKQGEVARASELLRTYDERYPSGQLAQERAAAGILVLCASGQVQAARGEARRFRDRWPRSPLVARIASSCAAEETSP